MELVHPLPAAAEDELGVEVQTTMDVANTAAGSGLHDADCSVLLILGFYKPFISVLATKLLGAGVMILVLCENA